MINFPVESNNSIRNGDEVLASHMVNILPASTGFGKTFIEEGMADSATDVTTPVKYWAARAKAFVPDLIPIILPAISSCGG